MEMVRSIASEEMLRKGSSHANGSGERKQWDDLGQRSL